MTASDRPTIDVEPAVGGWPAPWPAVAELATVLPKERWTLVGGLMVQLHTAHRGWGIVLHIETTRGIVSQTAAAWESISYPYLAKESRSSALRSRTFGFDRTASDRA